jgi:hypothetical protein
MSTKPTPPVADEHAVSFFGFAQQYQKAANLLHESDNTLSTPIYFLFEHAIELALKAYLRSSDIPIVADKKRKHHKITQLYAECGAPGLRIGPDDFFDIGNIVEMLEGANEEQGLRYFKMKGSTFPDLSWTRDTVAKLLQAVEPAVEEKRKTDGITDRAVKADMVFSKPVPTGQ